MKYQLVLQFSLRNLYDYDKLIEVEDALSKYLYGLAEVDGHDSRIGEMNIFLFTNEPSETFDKAKFVVKAADLLSDLSAGFRFVDGEEYTRLWPVGSVEPFTIK